MVNDVINAASQIMSNSKKLVAVRLQPLLKLDKTQREMETPPSIAALSAAPSTSEMIWSQSQDLLQMASPTWHHDKDTDFPLWFDAEHELSTQRSKHSVRPIDDSEHESNRVINEQQRDIVRPYRCMRHCNRHY